MLLLTFDLTMASGVKPLPEHLGGVLHGYVEGAVKNHAPHLLPVLRPNGNNSSAHFMILPPPVNQVIGGELRFGVMLFGLAAQAGPEIARALLAQQDRQINRRDVSIREAWVQQPGNPAYTLLKDGRQIEAQPVLEAADTLYSRIIAEQCQERPRRLYTLALRSPLLLASRKAQRKRLPATGVLCFPPLGSVMDSIAQRLRELEPGLAEIIGLPPGWKASEASRAIEPLTPAADPARPVEWQYSSIPRSAAADAPPAARRALRVPGIIGTLCYPASDDALEYALLYWGQWLGVGQKTTMGCGSYGLSVC